MWDLRKNSALPLDQLYGFDELRESGEGHLRGVGSCHFWLAGRRHFFPSCLDAVWLYLKLSKSFRYFDCCRKDFPYSANTTDDPRSQKRTDRKRLAVLIRLERSFSSLVEKLTCKRESLQTSRRSSEFHEAKTLRSSEDFIV
ncbi:unnamed protein product [Trifolium pratense]|uniref:Uncharacterized protein n=1 Tax=Trifolium pratense TaxID=57577 RepID=A0ACB0IYV5_TRIPR|nr:unnamed protein product [Trifolium pratense]